ncbi:hypothetical protein BDQ17DRAFT_652114 [Cyathus striatus]|nr:hypothetical protein BDQ17DRAFT_652114 [Cyathus striatus]
MTLEHSDRIARDFYLDALRSHESSLESLVISPLLGGKWCFGMHSIQSISKLISLRKLSITIVADSSVTSSESECQDRVAEEMYNSVHPVYTLLDIASLLPKLTVMNIHDASFAMERIVTVPEHESYITCPVVCSTSEIDTHIISNATLDPSKYRFALVLSRQLTIIECRTCRISRVL